jgi:hypothetical protein
VHGYAGRYTMSNQSAEPASANWLSTMSLSSELMLMLTSIELSLAPPSEASSVRRAHA